MSQLGALGIDEPGARDVPAAIAIDAGQVDEDQLWRIQAREQVGRFDHQGKPEKSVIHDLQGGIEEAIVA